MKKLLGVSTFVMVVSLMVVVLVGPVSAVSKSITDVTITSPEVAQEFEVGDIAVVKVVPRGDVSKMPYTLVVRSNSLVTQTFEILTPDWLGVEQEFAFKLNRVGSGSFTAYLEASDGSYALAECAYVVKTEADPAVHMSSMSVPWFTDGDGKDK